LSVTPAVRKTKVLHVIPTLDQSGAEKQLTLLATNLPADRFDVCVCALTRGGFYERPLREAGIPVRVLGKRLKWDPVALWRLFRLTRDEAPDIVHTWLFAGNSYGRVAARCAGRSRLVASERCVDRWKSGYQLAIDRWLARRTDVIVVNSHAVRDFYERMGIAGGKLRVIPNAVAAATNESDRSAIRGSLRLPPDVPVIGFVGRLWPQKRVHDLIWAADVLRISGLPIRVLVIGDGPRRAALERFARNIELDGIVHFLGHRPDASCLLSAIDIVVIPSEFEGMPNVALEAMGQAKPVVATRIPGMEEVVVPEGTGLLVGVGRPFELAKALRRLILDPDLRRRLGEAGRIRVREQFSVAAMIAAYQRLYNELVAT
jgi:glycosyltransferase involved in cell wall biosynthesis